MKKLNKWAKSPKNRKRFCSSHPHNIRSRPHNEQAHTDSTTSGHGTDHITHAHKNRHRGRERETAEGDKSHAAQPSAALPCCPFSTPNIAFPLLPSAPHRTPHPYHHHPPTQRYPPSTTTPPPCPAAPSSPPTRRTIQRLTIAGRGGGQSGRVGPWDDLPRHSYTNSHPRKRTIPMTGAKAGRPLRPAGRSVRPIGDSTGNFSKNNPTKNRRFR